MFKTAYLKINQNLLNEYLINIAFEIFQILKKIKNFSKNEKKNSIIEKTRFKKKIKMKKNSIIEKTDSKRKIKLKKD
ncbi:MAG: hypothetical protein IKV87_06940 [Methanobrevibacter sp.]|nr:hypothetical protein [Methanobrevibacter sp.]